MGGRGQGGDAPDNRQTIQLRKFAGVNQTDARTAIKDELSGDATEFYWLENAMPIGSGNLRLVPNVGSTLAIVTQTASTIWGFSLNQGGGPLPVLITVNGDGSMSKIDRQTGTQLLIAPAASVTTSARLAIWKDTPILIADPTKGYFTSTGTNISTITSTTTATDVAVFEGRTWLVTGTRSITFTEPNTFAGFNAAGGSGTATVTDSAFPGKITRLLSALEQLWIVGPGAVDAISNVATNAGVTTFSITNIVSNVGSTLPSSVIAFFRTFLMSNHYGTYAIVGATPQKLSDKLDGFWAIIQFAQDATAAVGTIYDVFATFLLVTITDPFTGTNRPLVLCFSQGKWFFASQGPLIAITSLLSANGDPEVWGTTGTQVYQLFGSTTATIAHRIMTKLFDFGSGVRWKHWLRAGLEVNSTSTVSIAVTAETETPAITVSVPLISSSVVTWVGAGVVTWTGVGVVIWVVAGLQLLRNQVPGGLLGRYLGWTLTGTTSPYILSAMQMQIAPKGQDWT